MSPLSFFMFMFPNCVSAGRSLGKRLFWQRDVYQETRTGKEGCITAFETAKNASCLLFLSCSSLFPPVPAATVQARFPPSS